jgi:hypothetical protein
MSTKKNTKVATTTPAPVVPTTPVKEEPKKNTKAKAQPVEQPTVTSDKPVKKGGKAKAEPTPVVTAQPASTPVEKPKRGGKAKAEPAPVVAQPAVAEKPKRGGKSKASEPKPVATTPVTETKKSTKSKSVATSASSETKKSKKSKKEVTATETETEKQPLANGKRYFKYIKGDEQPKGKYLAKKPKQAAVKAFSTISKNIRKSATDNSFLGVENKFYIAEYKGKGKIAKLIPYIGTIKLLENPIRVPIRDKNKQPIMVAGADGTMVQKEIVYKFDNQVVRDRTQAKIVIASTEESSSAPVTVTETETKTETTEVKAKKPTKPRTKKAVVTESLVTESSAHTLVAA